MRKCLRCETAMIENLIFASDSGHDIVLKEKGLFKSSLGKIKSAVCPQCGYTETYIDDLEKLKKMMGQDK